MSIEYVQFDPLVGRDKLYAQPLVAGSEGRGLRAEVVLEHVFHIADMWHLP